MRSLANFLRQYRKGAGAHQPCLWQSYRIRHMAGKPIFAVLGASHSGFGLAPICPAARIETRLFELLIFASCPGSGAASGRSTCTACAARVSAESPLTGRGRGRSRRGRDPVRCPAYGHRRMRKRLRPLKMATWSSFCPAARAGRLEFTRSCANRHPASIIVAEPQTSSSACTKDGPPASTFTARKRDPAGRRCRRGPPRRLERLAPPIRHIAARDVLDTGPQQHQ